MPPGAFHDLCTFVSSRAKARFLPLSVLFFHRTSLVFSRSQTILSNAFSLCSFSHHRIAISYYHHIHDIVICSIGSIQYFLYSLSYLHVSSPWFVVGMYMYM